MSPARARSIRVAARAAAGGALVAAAVTGALAVGSAPSGAAGRSCTAWATVRHRVALAGKPVTLRPQLRGTAGCAAQTADDGATADLLEPGAQPYPQRWTHFGAREKVTLHASLDRPGRYVFSHGKPRVYDANYEQVPATWHATAFTVKYGSQFIVATRSHGRAHGVLRTYSRSGWHRAHNRTVALQHGTAHGWRTVARRRTGRNGQVTFRRRLAGKYRLLAAPTRSSWGTRTRFNVGRRA